MREKERERERERDRGREKMRTGRKDLKVVPELKRSLWKYFRQSKTKKGEKVNEEKSMEIFSTKQNRRESES